MVCDCLGALPQNVGKTEKELYTSEAKSYATCFLFYGFVAVFKTKNPVVA